MRSKRLISRAATAARGFLLAAALGAPAAAQDLAAGRELAMNQCALCHGQNGIAVAPDAPNLAGNNPDYLAVQLQAFKSGARQHPQMSLIAAGLSDAQIRDVAAWFGRMMVTVEVPPLE